MNPGAVIITKFSIKYYIIFGRIFTTRIFSIALAGRTFVIAPKQAKNLRPECLRINRLSGACRPRAPR